MGIVQTDTLLRVVISTFIDDLRANPWLIDDIFSDFTTNPYLKGIYHGQIGAVKEWFLNNKIRVVLGYRTDLIKLPAVTIVIGPSPEMPMEKTMGDSSVNQIILYPEYIGAPIPYIMGPTSPAGYDQATGAIDLPLSTPGLSSVVVGQVVVNPANGLGFPITEITANGIVIAPGSKLDASQIAVCASTLFYQARIEHIWQDANFDIVCTTHGDPSTAIWLHDIILYGLLRYKEALLEGLGLSQTVMSSSALAPNHDYTTDGGESAWERTVHVNGKIEQTFIKSPRRYIENIAIGGPPNTSPGVTPVNGADIGAIQVLSNSQVESINENDNIWYAIEDDPNDESL